MRAKINAWSIGLLLSTVLLGGAATLAQNNSPYWHITTLYAFSGNADGAVPLAGVVLDSAGNVYGTTVSGGNFAGNCGSPGCGVVFKVDIRGDENLLYSFSGSLGDSSPYAGVVRDVAGRLYGQTSSFGATVFQLQPKATSCAAVPCPWNLSVLYNLGGGQLGGFPDGAPIVDSEGNVYSTTTTGGGTGCSAIGCGTVFKVDPQGNVTILHNFIGGPSDGYWPMGPLLLGADGSLYGTTLEGGSAGHGTVFKIDSSGDESILYNFGGGVDQPSWSGVIADDYGNLYGTAPYGGSYNCFNGGCGSVFELSSNGSVWTLTVLYSFQGGADGTNPFGGLLRDSQGNFYGTTESGGVCQFGPYCGTVYKLDLGGNKTTLWDFTGGTDGANPLYGSLVMDGQGNLYGTSQFGGDLSATNPACEGFGCGVVFRLAQ